jgi:hypothetical protein
MSCLEYTLRTKDPLSCRADSFSRLSCLHTLVTCLSSLFSSFCLFYVHRYPSCPFLFSIVLTVLPTMISFLSLGLSLIPYLFYYLVSFLSYLIFLSWMSSLTYISSLPVIPKLLYRVLLDLPSLVSFLSYLIFLFLPVLPTLVSFHQFRIYRVHLVLPTLVSFLSFLTSLVLPVLNYILRYSSCFFLLCLVLTAFHFDDHLVYSYTYFTCH